MTVDDNAVLIFGKIFQINKMLLTNREEISYNIFGEMAENIILI